MSKEKAETNGDCAAVVEQTNEKRIGCTHYKRRAKFVYTCLICNLFDDEDKRQYHCEGCGICRVGGRDRFFHCERCNMCLPVQLQRDGHRCVENVSRSNCPVCLEDIHTSRIPCHIPDCGHLLHRPCFEQLLHSGHYACPTCQTSMIDMSNLLAATSFIRESGSSETAEPSASSTSAAPPSPPASTTSASASSSTGDCSLPRASPLDEPPQA
ncbi:RING finger and CHY zinc finger domain-containing protein 1 [Papilio machaon]|uniref:RING finger and CHY zinc finger domain-containing protein 1 n=1 Tax=Papilio machaon TaxID=76193 RepID=A0A194QYR7_PAPMA|nr:RING finger and CHY zinc finger domain-containing protein 1 [Papilio machaon]